MTKFTTNIKKKKKYKRTLRSKSVSILDLPGGTMDRDPLANAGDTGLILGPCCGAAKPVSHNYGAHALGPRNCNY